MLYSLKIKIATNGCIIKGAEINSLAVVSLASFFPEMRGVAYHFDAEKVRGQKPGRLHVKRTRYHVGICALEIK